MNLKRTPIEEVTPTGIRVGDELIELDALVLATGFDAMTGALRPSTSAAATAGRCATSGQHGPRTYLGLAHAGFPNLFGITGAEQPVGAEQRDGLDRAARRAGGRDAAPPARPRPVSIEPTEEAEDAWVAHHRALGDASLYPRANSWYMGANVPGKPRVLLPYVGGVGRYREDLRADRRAGYEGFALRGPGGRELAVVPARGFADDEAERDAL